jgi:hypothetical protein
MATGMHDILSLWQAHREAGWPKLSERQGELMTLDTVISGCVTYFLDAEGRLDPQRVEILQSCLDDLNSLLPELDQEAAPYFERLAKLGHLLLEANR